MLSSRVSEDECNQESEALLQNRRKHAHVPIQAQVTCITDLYTIRAA